MYYWVVYKTKGYLKNDLPNAIRIRNAEMDILIIKGVPSIKWELILTQTEQEGEKETNFINTLI